MSSSFAVVLEEARCGIPLMRIAEVMAGAKGKAAKSLLGNLSKLQSGTRNPSMRTVEKVADALRLIHKLPKAKARQLQDQLMQAAGFDNPQGVDVRAAATFELSEAEERKRLHPACYKALRKAPGLDDAAVKVILDHIRVPTMKLIVAAAEKGEEIEVVQLQKIAAELRETAAQYSEADVTSSVGDKEVEIEAGRARILVTGEVSEAQLKVLKNAAAMIKSVLEL